MSFLEILTTVLISPLQLLFEVVYSLSSRVVDNPGLSITALSLVMNFLVLPLYMRSDAIQEEEQKIEAKLAPGIAHIKKTFKGDEQVMMLQTYYRQNHYKPTYVLRSALSLFLEIPFFIAAYQFLSGLTQLEGVSFGPIADLSQPDGLLRLGGFTVNLLPILMTAVNLVSCVIFTKGGSFRSKLQLYAMAIFFLVFLYNSPSGLVFYWTLNNVFSLVKTIFYKLKHPGRVLRLLACGAGILLTAFGLFCISSELLKRKLFFLGAGLLLLAPEAFFLLKGKLSLKFPSYDAKPNSRQFFLGGIVLALITGVVIPSGVIASSPQEFVDINYFYHPLWFIANSACLSLGTFVVWFGVFYKLANDKLKALMDTLIWICTGVAIINYMVFGEYPGVLNTNLQYGVNLYFSTKQQVVNAAVIVAVVIGMALLAVILKKHITQILAIGCAALCCMSISNVYTISDSIRTIRQSSEWQASQSPQFTLSENGKNVIVIMLDRAMGEYVPYLFNEKPELEEQFDGFTYYSNVISYGNCTNVAAPALFGGYEYTPYQLNQRSSESLLSKHNESLLMMPVLFDQNGYKVTFCDPVYANYQWIPDLSIFEEYPGIDTYITKGFYTDTSIKQSQIDVNKRTFFCYGLMKTVPLFLQTTLYNNGNYNNPNTGAQMIRNMYTADGITPDFAASYSTLQNLSSISQISQGSSNNFIIMVNDTTHDPVMLQEPEYTLSEHVDNTDYERENQDRFNLDGQVLEITSPTQLTHYQTNMAALLRLGEWFDYLRENGVYDNTRIILVADHGRGLEQIPELYLEDCRTDVSYFYPLLMVKDFNSHGFTTCDTFMTNADVPTLATQGLIEDPVNPFTGKAINSQGKNDPIQYVFSTQDWDVVENNGNVFLPGDWYSLENQNIWDKNNWDLAAQNAVSPIP